jgi:hypothetical protein
MKISVLEKVLRGQQSGERCCEGCRRRGLPLREVRIPYSGTASYWRDLCPLCIDTLKAAPELPPLENQYGKGQADREWQKRLDRLVRNAAEPI